MPSRAKIASLFTIVALGALAAVAMASGSGGDPSAVQTRDDQPEVRTEVARETVYRTARTSHHRSASHHRSRTAERGDDRGRGVEAGDDRGRGVEAGDDRSGHGSGGGDNSGHGSGGDDNSGHGSGNSGHGGGDD